MKKSLLVTGMALFLIVAGCQKEENQLMPDSAPTTNEDALQLKSASVSDYYSEIISTIEGMAAEGVINHGIANSLIANIQNAIKSLNKNNPKVFENQLKAIENKLGGLTKGGVIDSGIAEIILKKLKNGALLLKGSFIDPRDGNEYKVVLIGKQIWMAENLAYLPAVYPSSEGSMLDPHYYVYDYDGSSVSAAKATTNYNTYGVLYNWPAALTACPAGWHLPSDEEWKQLETELGLSPSDAETAGHRGTQGILLKSTSGWYQGGNGTNTSGFTALPGGIRDDYGYYDGIYLIGEFWSSTKYDIYRSWFRGLAHVDGQIFRWRFDDEHGRSVRCIKD